MLGKFFTGLVGVLCVVLVGWYGISVRPLPQADGGVPVDPVANRVNPVLPVPDPTPVPVVPGQTVVSITFDDGRVSDALGATILSSHGLRGTFFLNSGHLEIPGFLMLGQVDQIAEAGHEIAGHTVTHPDLATLTTDEITRQICDDRETLLGWGYQVRNFAYPFSSATPEIEQIAEACGYNSARSLGEAKTLHTPEGWNMADPSQSCAECAWSETIPPEDPMYTKAPAQVASNWSLDDLKTQVTNGAGGWVQLTFHGICPTDCSDITTAEDKFDQFTAWLAAQQAQGNLVVRTVGDVIGGPVNPPVPGPPPTQVVVNPGLEQTQDGVPSCWMRAAYGDNKPEFSEVTDTHSGAVAEKLVMRDYHDGDAKLLPTEDLGTCSIAVVPGQRYTISAWYHSTVPTRFSVQYRMARGQWVYGTASPEFEPAAEYSPASWMMPPVPPGITAMSFGLTLNQNGELTTDDYGLTPQDVHQ